MTDKLLELEYKWSQMFKFFKWKWQYKPFKLDNYEPTFVLDFDGTKVLIEVVDKSDIWINKNHDPFVKKIINSGWKGHYLVLGNTFQDELDLGWVTFGVGDCGQYGLREDIEQSYLMAKRFEEYANQASDDDEENNTVKSEDGDGDNDEENKTVKNEDDDEENNTVKSENSDKYDENKSIVTEKYVSDPNESTDATYSCVKNSNGDDWSIFGNYGAYVLGLGKIEYWKDFDRNNFELFEDKWYSI